MPRVFLQDIDDVSKTLIEYRKYWFDDMEKTSDGLNDY